MQHVYELEQLELRLKVGYTKFKQTLEHFVAY